MCQLLGGSAEEGAWWRACVAFFFVFLLGPFKRAWWVLFLWGVGHVSSAGGLELFFFCCLLQKWGGLPRFRGYPSLSGLEHGQHITGLIAEPALKQENAP